MNIVVLCGGTSSEREVSIVSGTNVAKALISKGHNARLLDVFFGTYKTNKTVNSFFEDEYDNEKESMHISSLNDEVLSTSQNRKGFFGENVIEICNKADVVFMALHGANGEDGKVQATFELFGIKYTGTDYLGSALAMDKGLAKQLFIYNNVPTPKGFEIEKNDGLDYLKMLKDNNIDYPVVVKPCCGGSSVGVSLPNNDEEYKKALEEAFKYEDKVVVEKYIKGREYSIGVINGKALPVIEIIPDGWYDYENKYNGNTKEVCPANINDTLKEKLQKEAEHVAKVLKLGVYSRIDFLSDENEDIYCLEANTLPGMTPTSLLPQEAAVMGIEYPELCEMLINESLKN